MANVVLFHHAYGPTTGVHHFAEQLREVGHEVTVPDLFEGQVFATLEEGLGYAKRVGFDTIIERGRVSAQDQTEASVFAGFSLGVLPAQLLAQTRPGARGALLFSGCVSPSEFSDAWPASVPVQIHGMAADEFFEEDLESARQLISSVPDAELFLYEGSTHLFADNSLDDYNAVATAQLLDRVRGFLASL